MMKKFLLYTLLVMITTLSACKKDLTNRFYNPDKLSQAVGDPVPGLFTSTLNNVYINLEDYFEWYYLLADGMGVQGYIQLCNRYVSYRYNWYSNYNNLVNGNGIGGFEDYGFTSVGGHIAFENTYQFLKSWETIKGLMDTRTGQAKQDANMYFKLVSVIKCFQVCRLVDLCNSVPYFDAFQGSTGGPTHYFPAYDDPQKIYESVIDQLGNLVDSLPVFYNQMSSTAQSTLANQDLAFKGDIGKWVEYANALRLKLLVRISGVDEAFVKQRLPKVFEAPLPTEDLYWQTPSPTDLQNGITWQRGIRDQPYTTFMTGIIMKRLNYGTAAYEPGTDDPRLPVLAFPTYHHDYRAISYNIDSQTVIYNSGEHYYPYADDINSSLTQNAKSMYSLVTFHNNPYLPVFMFTLGQLDLLEAEIELKGLAPTGKTADQHIRDEVIHSTKFWYAMNQLSQWPAVPFGGSTAEDANSHTFDTLLHPTLPPESVIENWADTIQKKFVDAPSLDDKMEILMQQKFIHLNLIDIEDEWADFRRTRHPKLEPFTYEKVVMKPVPERIQYPTSELSGNQQNYLKVAAQNNNTTPIFWVPAAERNVVPYWDGYNYK
jgi:hypothetical protein